MTTPIAAGSVDSGASGTTAGASDVLAGTTLGGLDRPINDILSDLGLPSLPQLPAAPVSFDLPPLPVIDLSVLTRPLTDIASAFGTGQLGAGLNIDPTKVLEGVSTALQQAMTLASTVAQLASSWQGSGASGATDKAGAAQVNTLELQGQNVQQKTILTNASATVATGAASMAAIIAKFLAAVTASAPFLVTPPGQIFLLSMATETAAEATAVAAKTKGELAVQSVAMTSAGEKVKVTDAPSGVDSLSQISQLLSLVSPLTSAVSTGAKTVQDLQSIAQPIETADETTPVEEKISPVGAGGMGGGGVPLAGLSATAPVAQTITPRSASAPPSVPGPAADAPAASRAAAATGTGMMPMSGMGAGMGHHAGEAEGDDEVRSMLVTAEHGDDVIGELGNTGVAVVGATGSTTARAAQS